MNKIKLIAFALVLSATAAHAQNVGINNSGAAPAASAMLDITSTTKGLLIPRVALTMTTAAAPVTAPATSLMVYNTATVADVTPGYYYWNGTVWVRFLTGNGTAWVTTGNAGTTFGTNFVGTTDAQGLDFRTGNTIRFRIPNSNAVYANGNGTAAAPFYSWNADQDMGIFRNATDELSFATASIEAARFTSTQRFHLTTNGTAALPVISWTTDPNTGIFHSALADDIGFSTAGLTRFQISDAGEVYCGATAPLLPGDLFNATASNANALTSGSGNLTWAVNGYTAYNGGAVYGLRLTGATGTWGAVQGETSATNPANSPGVSGSVSNASHIGVRGFHPVGAGWGGIFYNDLGYTGGVFNASDRSLKKNISSLNGALMLLSKIPIYSYEYKTDEYDVLGEKGEIHYGVMADELKVVLPFLVKSKSLDGVACRSCESEIKDIDHKVEMVNYVELVPIAVQAINEQQKQIEDLKRIVAEQQKLIEELLKK